MLWANPNKYFMEEREESGSIDDVNGERGQLDFREFVSSGFTYLM
jgi:hypothetical protein